MMLFEFPTLWFRRLVKQSQLKTSSKVQGPERGELTKLFADVSGSTSRKTLAAELQSFIGLHSRYSTHIAEHRIIKWENVGPPTADSVTSYNVLPQSVDASMALNQLAIVKLDGLGQQSMGSSEATSNLEVKNGVTCLDLTVQQIDSLNSTYNADVLLIILSSYLTHDSILSSVKKYTDTRVNVTALHQSRYPSVPSLSSTRVQNSKSKSTVYPPGHGDLYESLHRSGLLDQLLSQGKRYLFVSNSNNLGSTFVVHDLDVAYLLIQSRMDLTVLQHIVDKKIEFAMEVTNTSDIDPEGGIVLEYDGKIRLLERAQVPSDQLDKFKSLRKFGTFNTNNLWIYLPALKQVMDSGGLNLDIIAKTKVSEDGQSMIQLETAAGAAISHFKNVRIIKVPQSRFLPVKRPSDLLIVRSNLYHIQDAQLVMNEQILFRPPTIKLSEHFRTVPELERRFATVPDLLELDQLTISGDVYLGRKVKLRGTIIIIADEGQRLEIPSDSDLENRLISGNLTVTDL
ncbi:hypothetical protein M378DRAFT_21754 [Amanita muscaria Koide BX008]|uniref:UTP--glucose-1-phosphate uridylyltransferase n=1 Tax=Amanita muscaria (strain Koide BX008) TaxID=946122 RepID=A0A0C2XIM4_AMAMK|nr:hypothetical protein M378DRAFT_21754 [Amanita muscaria Koide BX008]